MSAAMRPGAAAAAVAAFGGGAAADDAICVPIERAPVTARAKTAVGTSGVTIKATNAPRFVVAPRSASGKRRVAEANDSDPSAMGPEKRAKMADEREGEGEGEGKRDGGVFGGVAGRVRERERGMSVGGRDGDAEHVEEIVTPVLSRRGGYRASELGRPPPVGSARDSDGHLVAEVAHENDGAHEEARGAEQVLRSGSGTGG